MGIKKDLHLTGNDFSNASSFFFVAYLVAEIPNGIVHLYILLQDISNSSGYLLNVLPTGKWLGVNVILWGITTACTASVTNYKELLAVRILLGVFEAAIGPCLMLISSQWYTKSEQAPRFCIWYMGLGFAQILGSVLSYAFQHVESTVLSSWKIMFVVVGCVTILIGLVTLIRLPDSPMSAVFLSESEKVAVLEHIEGNQTGVVDKRVQLGQVWELMLDGHMWLMCILTICVSP